jgi:hypothetical protein
MQESPWRGRARPVDVTSISVIVERRSEQCFDSWVGILCCAFRMPA